jgi:hypothetical protein
MFVSESRRRALMAIALRADDARTSFIATLRRARGATSAGLPLSIDLTNHSDFSACALGGWSFSDRVGSWTDGPIAQLLVVPSQPPQGNIVVAFDIGAALVSPAHPRQAITPSVNGVLGTDWIFNFGHSWEAARQLIVDGSAVERLGAFLITFQIHMPQSLEALGVRNDPRTVGIALRGVTLRPAAAKDQAK